MEKTPLKIINLTAENVKRIRAVSITPDGAIVDINGKNGQGKTTVIDCIWWALEGAEHIQAMPINKDADFARIKLELGPSAGHTEMTVRKTFTAAGNVTLTVENAEGFRAPSPQAMLDSFLGALSFDPLGFTRMKPREQFDALRAAVDLPIDIGALDEANRADFAKRTEINRDARSKRTAAESVQVPEGLPEQAVDTTALLKRMADASTHNSEIERRKSARATATAQVAAYKSEADAICAAGAQRAASIASARDRRLAEIDAEIERLTTQRDTLVRKSEVDIKDTEAETSVSVTNKLALASELQAKLDAAEALPEAIDVSALQKEIEAAQVINRGVETRARRRALEAEAEAFEAQAKALTDAMDARNKEKADAIGAADMPVAGLSFGDGHVLLNGVPFEQASKAEQTVVGMRIAMAANPRLRVIRIEDGSLLDSDTMKIIADLAEKHDYQVWIERVDSTGTTGFVIEDGRVKGQEFKPEPPPRKRAAKGKDPQ